MNRAQQILAKSSDPAIVTGRLNVQDFVEARKAEIARLESSLAVAAVQGKKRAFQTVPRRLRRRTASHNPERVPKRLRKRARAEASQDSALPPKKRPDHGRQPSPISPPTDNTGINTLAPRPTGKRYSNRQKSAVWLPTHVWHMKRAHTEARWGFKVPLRPTLKFYRATHRISDEIEAGMAWDTSYFATIAVHGERDALEQLVSKHFAHATKLIYTSGQKTWQGMIEEGPVLLYWQPACLIVHAHPELFETLWNMFQDFERHDCRYSIGSIELMGKRALSTLATCLKPHPKCGERASATWRALRLVGSLDSLPRHAALNLDVCDPRRFNPPHKQRPRGTVEKALTGLEDWPHTTAKLFDLDSRSAAVAAQEDLKALNKQRVPGEHLGPGENALPITILALDGGRVRVLLPWEWVSPVWVSLMHSQLSVGGLVQQEQISFERGMLHFPRDYPLTAAGQQWAQRERQVKYDAYFRRPAAKRESYKEEVGDAFSCDWSLLGDQALSVQPVVVKTVRRGAPRDGARIYALPADQIDNWLRTADSSQCTQPPTPGPEHLIGFVTSGNYNLETGTGTGVGSCLRQSGWCLVRNVGQVFCRLARLEPAKTCF